MRDDLPDLALSIRQPWCLAILALGKNIENRTWSTKVRGPICIHASAGMTRGDYLDCLDFIHSGSALSPLRINLPEPLELMRGGIVGTVEIVDCVKSHPSPWFQGPYGFVLANAKVVQFIPVKGALGFFGWRNRIIAGHLMVKSK